MRTITSFEQVDMDHFYFIAHLFDRVLVGEKNGFRYDELVEGFDNDCVIEMHLFNPQKEIFVAREQGVLAAYPPMEHEEGRQERPVFTRNYWLDKQLTGPYETLEVKEYVSFDEHHHMACIAKTVLCKLKRAGER